MHFSPSTITTLVTLISLTLPAHAVPAALPADSATDAPVAIISGNTPVTNIDTAAGTTGQSHVRNYCTFPVYLYACSGDPFGCTGIYTLPAKTGTYAGTYYPVNDGRSIKIGTVTGEVNKPILQLEYTNTGTGQVSYDLSEVSGNPLGPYGFTLTSSNAACFHVHCAPPATSCPGVFTDPTNGTPLDCQIGDGIGVTLCG